MFIQLTRTDGVPVWLNACFVVTVAPTRGGGSIVVPIGDGLDYEVREAPETVLSLLEGAPPAKVVPVPPPKTLTPRPDDVSPDVNPGDCDKVPEDNAVPELQKKVRRKKSVPVRKPAADAEMKVSPKPSADGQSVKASEQVAKKRRTASKKKKTSTVINGSASAENLRTRKVPRTVCYGKHWKKPVLRWKKSNIEES